MTIFDNLEWMLQPEMHYMQWWIQDFPEGGAPTCEGAPTYYLVNLCQKLHENEEFLTQRRAHINGAP